MIDCRWGLIGRYLSPQSRTLHYRRTATKTLCGLPVIAWKPAIEPRPEYGCGNCVRIRRAEIENQATPEKIE